MRLEQLNAPFLCTFVTPVVWSLTPLLLPALELLKNAIAKAGYTDKIVIGMDVAASEFYKGGKYDLDFKSPDDPGRYISAEQLADLYRGFVKDYPGSFSAPKRLSRPPLLPPSGQSGELAARGLPRSESALLLLLNSGVHRGPL